MKVTRTILDHILVDVRKELAEAKARTPLAELQARLRDAPPVRSLPEALQGTFGLIAEIKECSPSQGKMRSENVLEAPAAYAASPIVRAVSVLTNTSHFGMSAERLSATREIVRKPVLRKDFIFDDYQVYEARAFGADAILLMANLLEPGEMQGLFLLARDLGMEPLFECHDREQIEQVPTGAKVFGVNSRSFAVGTADYERARAERASGAHKDSTTDLSRFELGRYLPAGAIKVAESGVHPHTIARIRDELGYHAALVGTSLLMAAHGIHRELLEFEQALRMSPKPSRSKIRS